MPFFQASIGKLSVCGVRFRKGSLGPKELCFKYQDMQQSVRIEVTAGHPAKIILLEKPEIVCHTFEMQENKFMNLENS